MEQSRNKQIITTIVVLVAVVIAVGAVVLTKKKPASTVVTTTAPDTTPTSTLAETTTATNTAPAATGTYKDGTYSAAGNYYTPESSETLNVSVTIKDGVITASSADGSVHSRESEMYQAAFLNNYQPLVVGKKVDQVALSRVSGSSLTSQGFNDALAQIKQQALS